MIPRYPALFSALALAFALCAVDAIRPVHAQGDARTIAGNAVKTFDVPAGRLDAALDRFARTAGVNLSYEPALIADAVTAGLSGEYSIAAALQALLAASGLEAIAQPGGGYVLRRIAVESTQIQVLPPVRVESHFGESGDQTYTTAGSVNVVTRSDLDKVAVSSARDVLAEVPGVWVSDGRQNPGINVNIRGLQGQGRNNVMVDGTRQNAARYNGYAGINSTVYVDPELIAGISVEKGPSSGVYGAGAIGGVVNIRTLEAADLLKPGQRVGGQLRGTFGESDARLPGVASLAGAWRLNESIEFTAAVSRRYLDDYASGRKNADPRMLEPPSIFSPPPIDPGDDVPNTHQKTGSALLKAGLKFGADQRLTLGATRYRSEYSFDNFLGSTASGTFYNPVETNAHAFTANYAWEPADNEWFDLRVNLWQTATEDEDRAEEATATALIDRKMETRGFEVYNSSRFDGRWLDAELQYGGEWFEDDGRKSDVAGKRRVGGLFTRTTLNPADWLQIEAALRYDSYRMQGSGLSNGTLFGQNSRAFSIDRGEARVNPSVSLSLFPLDGLQFYARYSEGFRPPTITENMMSGIAFITPISPNLELRPEIARSREYGVNYLRDGVFFDGHDGLRFKWAWFDNRYVDYINRSYTGGGFTTTPLALTFVNLDRARFEGWELQARYDAGIAFIDISHTRFNSITFCDAGSCIGRIGTEGDFGAPFLPPGRKTVANLGFRIPTWHLMFGVRMRHDSKVMDVATENDYVGQRWAAYRVYDLYGHYNATSTLRLSFSVENIQDHYYVDANAGWRRAASPGRSFSASIQYTF